MICPKCHSENPEPNRFCGMCGSRLQETAPAEQARPANGSDAAKSGTSGVRRPFIVSTTAMADVTAQMLNTRVVLPSPSIGSTTHSGYVSPLRTRVDDIGHGENLPEPEIAPVDPNDEPMFSNQVGTDPMEGTVHEFDLDSPEEQEAEEWLERSVAEHEAHMPPPGTETPGSILNLSAPVETPLSEPIEEQVYEREVEEEPVRNSFLQYDPPSESSRGSVSGPSFLGLDEPPSQDYLLDESESHTGRNLLLVALVAIVAVLGYMEWRASSRGESTNPVDVLHLKLPKKKGQGPAEVAQPTASTPGGTSATDTANNSGKPDLIAEPNQSAAQTGNPAPRSEAAAPATAATNSSPAGGYQSAANTDSKSPAPSTAAQITTATDTKSGTSAAQKPAPTEVAKSTPPAATKAAPTPGSDIAAAKPTASKAAAITATKQSAPDAPQPETDSTLSAGGFELQKGKAAGATDDGRMWLWKSVAKGNGEAPVLLADMYLQGRGVAKDCEQAMLLLNAAAKKANPRARTKLGSLYATGECVSQDRVQAYKWMTSALAANPGSDWIEKNRKQLLSEMTPSERKRAAAIQ